MRALLLLLWATATLARAQVTLEYIAHACFIFEAPNGQRLAVDPYNGYRWLGYQFPEGVAADAVLVTHPHYDHDASYYFPATTPVIRHPGDYQIGPFRITGLTSSHAGGYGKEFGAVNTIFIIETGGLRIAHFGDGGPLSPEALKLAGRVDIALLPIDGQDHILKPEQIEEIRTQLKPAIIVPMHYQIPELSDLPDSLGPIAPWLATQANVTRLNTHRATLRAADLKGSRVLLFRHSPLVRPWPERWHQAWAERKQGGRLHLERAWRLAPEISVIAVDYARLLRRDNEHAEARRVLEQLLAAGGRHDWEYTEAARLELADLYRASGDLIAAAEQCWLVLASTYRLEFRDRARRLLAQVTVEP